MRDEKIAIIEKKEGFADWLRGIKRDPLTMMTLIVGSGFVSVCFYFLGLYCLTVYWTGEPWNLRAIIFSPLPIDRLHATGFGFILVILMSGIAFLIWKTLHGLKASKKMPQQRLAQNIIFILGMSFLLAFFISSSALEMFFNTLLCAMLGIILAIVVAHVTHMLLNTRIVLCSLVPGLLILVIMLILPIDNIVIESFTALIFFFLTSIIYWLLFLIARTFSIGHTVTLQNQVEDGFKGWKKYDNRQKRNLLIAIPIVIMFGIFLTIANTAHMIYTIGGDQWLSKPYQTIYVERMMHEEAPVDSAISNEKRSQLYQEQGFYIGERGGLVTYIDQEGNIIRRKDVVMIQEQPSSAQGSSNE